MSDDGDAFDKVMGSLDPPMAIVTTVSRDGTERAGCLIGFHAQCSIGPERYAVWLSKANHTYAVGVLATRFAVHWLTERDLGLAEAFGTRSGDDVDKFADVAWTDAGEGLPTLDELPNRAVCRKHTLLDDGSDHVCFVLVPEETSSAGRFTPLRLASVSHLDPGHGAEERQTGF